MGASRQRTGQHINGKVVTHEEETKTSSALRGLNVERAIGRMTSAPATMAAL